MKLSKKRLFSLLTALIFISLSAQTPAEDLVRLQKKYKGEKLIRLNKDIKIDIKVDKNEKFSITKSIIETDFILYKQASAYNEDYVRFSKLIDLNYVKAKTLYPEAKRYKEYKVDADHYTTKDKQSSSIFFDDNKETRFIYPKLVQGAKREVDYQLEIKEPRLLSSIYMQSYIHSEAITAQVVTDKNINLGFKIFFADTFDIQYTKEEKKGRIYHTWKAKNIPKYEYEDMAPDLSHFIPQIILYINDYTINGTKKTMLSSPKGLHEWYASLVKDVNTQENKELAKIVETLVEDGDTELEKVQKIYAWVQSNIKYVAFESGYGGFIPREAVDICEKRFGDCKDMASIITEMLEIADVKANLTWIGTRDIPFTYEEVHTPSVDNHMIASYTDKTGKVTFLDATSSYLPFGMVSEFIQGKQAMVHIDNENFKLVNVPETDPEKNLVYDSVHISMNEDLSLKGTGQYEINGYTKVKFRYFFPSLTTKEKKDYVKDAFEKGNNKFTVNSTSDENFEERDKPSIIKYDFNINNYINQSDDELYINLHLDKYLKSQKLEDDRKLPYEVPYKYINKQVVLFDIPTNYKVSFIPENKTIENKDYTFVLKYSKENNQLKLSSTVTMKTLLLIPDQFEDWNKFIKALNKKYNEVVILKKK